MRQTSPNQSAESAETVLSFVNTRLERKKGNHERFADPDNFMSWAREHGFTIDELVSESQVAAARELRAALVTVMHAHTESASVTVEQLAAAEAYLDHAGGLYPVKVSLASGGASLKPLTGGVAGIFGQVLAAASTMAGHGTWERLKACSSEPCEHGFLDQTRNGTQRFCKHGCNSREAMRRMREQQPSG